MRKESFIWSDDESDVYFWGETIGCVMFTTRFSCLKISRSVIMTAIVVCLSFSCRTCTRSRVSAGPLAYFFHYAVDVRFPTKIKFLMPFL